MRQFKRRIRIITRILAILAVACLLPNFSDLSEVIYLSRISPQLKTMASKQTAGNSDTFTCKVQTALGKLKKPPNWKCLECGNGERKSATRGCLTCSINLCDTCASRHTKAEDRLKHKLYPISAHMYCDKPGHDEKPIQSFSVVGNKSRECRPPSGENWQRRTSPESGQTRWIKVIDSTELEADEQTEAGKAHQSDVSEDKGADTGKDVQTRSEKDKGKEDPDMFSANEDESDASDAWAAEESDADEELSDTSDVKKDYYGDFSTSSDSDEDENTTITATGSGESAANSSDAKQGSSDSPTDSSDPTERSGISTSGNDTESRSCASKFEGSETEASLDSHNHSEVSDGLDGSEDQMLKREMTSAESFTCLPLLTYRDMHLYRL